MDERSGTQSSLTKAFVDRFGIVKDANTTATSNQPGQLPSARLLSDNLVLTAYGQFDFSRFKLPDGQTGLFETAPAASPYLIRGRTDLVPLEAGTQNTVYNKFLGSDYLMTRLGLLPGVVSCPSVRNSFFAEFQPLFFQRPASLGWFLMGLLHLWALRCACFLCNFRHTRRHCPCPMRTVLFGLV